MVQRWFDFKLSSEFRGSLYARFETVLDASMADGALDVLR